MFPGWAAASISSSTLRERSTDTCWAAVFATHALAFLCSILSETLVLRIDPRAHVQGPSAPQAPAWRGEGAQTCLWNCMGMNLVQEQPWGKSDRLRVKLV